MDSIRRAVALACGVLAGALAPPLQAASLGEIEIRSELNSPLHAVLHGTVGDIAEDSPIDVRIVEPGWVADPGLKARVRSTGAGDIVITSVRPVSEPMFTLRLQVRASGIVLTREYPVILDLARPHAATAAAAPAAEEEAVASAQAPVVAPEPQVATAKPDASEPRCGLATPEGTAGFDSTRNVYGPITDGESLRLVALRVRPWRDCMPVETLMRGIYAHNTSAFYGTPDRLRTGRSLTVPSVAALRAGAPRPPENRLPSPEQRPRFPEEEQPAGSSALLLSGFVSAAHAAPRDVDLAALEMTLPAQPPPAPIQSAALAPPRVAADRSPQPVPAWMLALVLSSCGILVLLKRPGALPLRGLARTGTATATGTIDAARAASAPAASGAAPAGGRLPLEERSAPGPAVPDRSQDGDAVGLQLPLSFTATADPEPGLSPRDPPPRAKPAASPAASPAVALDPWERLNLENRRLTGCAIHDGIDDTSRLVRAGPAAAEPADDPSPEMTEIADLIKATLRRQPARLDLQMKLFDIYHDMRMSRAFQQEARKIAGDPWATRQVDWTAINALWQDLSPGAQLLEMPGAVPAPLVQPAVQAPAAARHRRFADVATEIAGGLLERLANEYDALRADPEFLGEVGHFAATLSCRPTPLTTDASNLLGGAPLLLKREDQRAIAPEVDNALVQAIVAQIMGRKRLVTGNDSQGHSLALAMAAARLRMECVVYLRPSELHDDVALVSRLRLLGARIETTDPGTQILADPREGALRDWMNDPEESFLALSLGTGPHPYPLLVSDARSLLGRETLEQFRAQTRRQWPAVVVAAASSRADAIGFMLPFLNREDVRLLIAETPVSGGAVDPGPCQGLQREHAWLRSTGRVDYVTVSQQDAARVMDDLARFEGICVSPGDAGAVALARSLTGPGGGDQPIVVLVA